MADLLLLSISILYVTVPFPSGTALLVLKRNTRLSQESLDQVSLPFLILAQFDQI